MTLLRQLCRGLPAYFWQGWGALCSLLLLLAAWEAASSLYSPLILPDPGSVFARLQQLFANNEALPELLLTARRALTGLMLALLAGSLLGLAAGLLPMLALLARPLVTVLLGTPPVAWLVLAMLWFGARDGTPVFTVFVACFPVIFSSALQGARTLDQQLRDMASVFKLPWRQRCTDLYLPHLAAYLFPATITALGTSWKVVVMAELLACSDGVGAALAISRAHLDTTTTLAWIGSVVGSLLLLEYLVLEPLKREIERWRLLDAEPARAATPH